MRRLKEVTTAEKKRARDLADISKAMGAFKPASEVLTKVRAVPTVLVQLDHALRVGGWPLERIAGIHGPTHEGKTLFTLMLVLSFIQRQHFVLYLDAEHTTDIDWVTKLMGDSVQSPFFRASRTSFYEDVVEEVRLFFETVAELRKAKKVPEDTGALVVVDSLRKLIPKDLFKKISEGKGGMDGASGRAEQIKAKFNAAWMDELVPLVSRTGGAIVFVLREHEDTEADAWARKFGNDYKVGGGKAVQFDSSLLARVTRSAWVKEGQGEDTKILGERHKVTIRKSKIAGKEGKVSVAYFHSSNGKLVPEGHDRARDVLELAEQFGVVEKAGNWLVHADERIAHGLNNAVKALHENPEWLGRIESDVRAYFKEKEPVEFDEETGEVT